MLENLFRQKITYHVGALPAEDAQFQKFNTSPFVLLIHAMQRGYSQITQIEKDILPAKQFSSMETSAGRMVEAVALPAYGWTNVMSEMHTPNSALDGKKLEGDTLKLATLKSGPRCLNDEMSENFADAIINHSAAWAAEARVKKLDFTYGVLYGTEKVSNKKDWHILRNIKEKLPRSAMSIMPDGRWDCQFKRNGLQVHVTVRIGKAWWDYLGGATCFVELCAALIRACVKPGECDPEDHEHLISDLGQIVSLTCVPADFNVSILQRGQLQWLFFIARHFCDSISDA
ncbi:MAG: hypothetical protein GX591_00100 [Planctomycetes bacterium]|nr:hypothetical protein [Planctomycetota bacterium]